MFILIHGANHSSRCWEPMIDHLNAPALAIDLPGRGRHPAPLDKVHLSDFIESAVADIEGADLRDAILVGHSIAGLSMPGIVDRVHDRLRHIVFVSCIVPQHGESMLSELPEEFRELANSVAPDPAGALPGRKLSVQTMCYDMDQEQTAFTLGVRVAEAYWPMRDSVDLSGLRHPVPRTWVKLMADRTPTPEQADILAERAGCTDVVELDSGHFAMITHPQQLADVLDQLNSH
jgi:pimeloyl-ACP methyl ester carboxylesterase